MWCRQFPPSCRGAVGLFLKSSLRFPPASSSRGGGCSLVAFSSLLTWLTIFRHGNPPSFLPSFLAASDLSKPIFAEYSTKPHQSHYSLLFGTTVIRGVKHIWPYSSLAMDIEYWVVCGDQKARNNDNILSFAQQNLKYSLQTQEKSSGFSLGFFSRLSWMFAYIASKITEYCPTLK